MQRCLMHMRKGSFRMSYDVPSILGNSDYGDGLLNLMVSYLRRARLSGFRRRPPAPASLMIYVVGSESRKGPPSLPSSLPPSFLLRPGVRKNSRSSAKTELALSLQIRPTSLVLNPGEEEDAAQATGKTAEEGAK